MSQVPIGFTRKIKWDKNYKYHFIETLIFGNAIERATKPERIIIGKNYHSQKINMQLQKFLMKYKCPIF